MIIELNEKNFNEEIAKQEKVLVFFYREKGCSFCDEMKPIVTEYAEDNVVGFYKLGNSPDDVTDGLVNRFPTFVAYINGQMVGKQEGSMPKKRLALTFTPEKLPQQKDADPKGPQPGPVTLEQASLIQLLTEEANLIDEVGKLRSVLSKIQQEIKRRKKMAMGKVDCCESCADGGSCADDHKH